MGGIFFSYGFYAFSQYFAHFDVSPENVGVFLLFSKNLFKF